MKLLLWLIIALIVGVGYVKSPAVHDSIDGIIEKIKEIDLSKNETISNQSLSSGNGINTEKMELGKITKQVDISIDCDINEQCQDVYGAEAFCENGICYKEVNT